jgi:heme-degrading monooxygenase HmoA
VRERLGIAAGGALAFLTSTPGVEFALGAVVLVLGVPVWSGYSHEIGIALVAAGAIAVVHGAVTFVLEERRRRAAAAAEEERGHAEMRRISDLARELLLETTLWTDIDEFRSWVQARQWQAERELRPPREWSVASIVGRGREDLDADAVDDWIALARGLRQQAQQLADMIDQEFPGQPAERRSELRTVYRAVDSASSAAQHLAAARTRLIQTHWTTPEEKRAAEDALRSNLDLFYGACEWIEGTVMRIEPDAELLQAIESSHLRHGKDAAERAAARRELQAISARSGAQMLIDAAPSAGVLVRSTLGRSGTLHDIAADEAFALRSDD